MAIAGYEQDETELKRVKQMIHGAYMYFKDNAARFQTFRQYVFKESITEAQRSLLMETERPITEFNILEAYISRLLGEFSKHEPGIEVSPSEGAPIQQPVLDIVEGHLRHVIHESDKNSFSYETYKDALSGGYSVAKVYTDYAGPMSFEQQIYLKRVFDPSLCGFDPMARATHKGDGNYSFELYPMLLEDFKRTFPKVETADIQYSRDLEGFTWSYENSNMEKILLVAEFYEKKKRKVKIVKLANGRSMTEKNYKALEKYWVQEQFIEQIPVVVKTRKTEMETICCTVLMDNHILKYYETDFSYLPHVFFDGNSILLTHGTNNNSYQMTRPYVYHAKGIQDMMNFAGQTVCNSMENLIQHKFIVMKEALPQEKDYLEALNNIQRANTIVVNAFYENNPDQAIPTPIREVQNIPLPPEVMNAFQVTGPMTQAILGSFGSNLGDNDHDLSGKAVIESAAIGNAAAMPYIVSYLAGLTQVANIIVDLIPKYLVGSRVIAVQDKAGNKTYQKINGKSLDEPLINYDERAIKVNVKAGINFQVQKSQALSTITALMSASEEFAAFMNSDEGLPILLSNLTIYGSDRIKEAAEAWMQKRQQMQQQAQAQAMAQQQMAQQIDPKAVMMMQAQAEIMKVDQKKEAVQTQAQVDLIKISTDDAVKNKQADIDMLKVMSEIQGASVDQALKQEKLDAENARTAVEMAVNVSAHHHDVEHADRTHELDKKALEKSNASSKGKES